MWFGNPQTAVCVPLPYSPTQPHHSEDLGAAFFWTEVTPCESEMSLPSHNHGARTELLSPEEEKLLPPKEGHCGV